VYIITGYGHINSSLYKRGAIEDADVQTSCQYCGEEETVDHLIYFCDLYDDLRKQNLKISDLLKSEMIESELNYYKFLQFAREVFDKRTTTREILTGRL